MGSESIKKSQKSQDLSDLRTWIHLYIDNSIPGTKGGN